MDEILKKLDEIGGRIGAIEKRIEKVESLSIATSQKVVAMNTPPAPKFEPGSIAPIVSKPFVSPAFTSPAPVNDTLPPVLPPLPPKYAPEIETAVSPTVSSGAFESYFGRWILGIVGLMSLLFGISFFLKYAFDQNWIAPAGRIIIGVLFGAIFILLGEFVRKGQAKYAEILYSAGLAIFYLSTYAAYGYYELISAGTSFLFTVAITTFGVVLSLWADSMEMASLTATMGFLVPYFFGLKAASDFGYFIYALALNIGVLSISFVKKWRRVTAIGFIGTVFNFAGWYLAYYSPGKMAIAIYALVVFYLIYLVASIAHNFISDEHSDEIDLSILTLNPLWFFFQLYNLLQPGRDTLLSVIALVISASYLLLAYLFRIYRNDDKSFSLFLGAVGALFLTIAVPLMFSQNAITIAWAVEAAIIAILGAVTGNDGLKRFSIAILVVALVHFFSLDNFNEDLNNWLPIFNKQFFTYLILIFSTTTIAYLFGHLMGEEYRSDARVIAILWTVVNLLTLFAITGEIVKYFDQADLRLGQLTLTYDHDPHATIDNQRNAAVSVFWTIYAVVLISLGIVARNPYLRKSALVLFGVTIFKVFIFDLSALDTLYRIISFMVLGIILLIVSYLYFRHQKNIETEPVSSL